MENKILSKMDEFEKRIKNLEEMTKMVSGGEISKSFEDVKVGTMMYAGKFETGDKRSADFAEMMSISNLVKLNSKDIAQVADAFSSEERVEIIKLLLQKSMTAKDVMQELNFPTTGKVYHHLSFLEKMGIVEKSADIFSLSMKYLPCVLLIFAGVDKIFKK